MTLYRCYLLTSAGTIRTVEVIDAATDGDAIHQAQAVFRNAEEYYGYELWDRGRRIHHHRASRPPA